MTLNISFKYLFIQSTFITVTIIKTGFFENYKIKNNIVCKIVISLFILKSDL